MPKNILIHACDVSGIAWGPNRVNQITNKTSNVVFGLVIGADSFVMVYVCFMLLANWLTDWLIDWNYNCLTRKKDNNNK